LTILARGRELNWFASNEKPSPSPPNNDVEIGPGQLMPVAIGTARPVNEVWPRARDEIRKAREQPIPRRVNDLFVIEIAFSRELCKKRSQNREITGTRHQSVIGVMLSY